MDEVIAAATRVADLEGLDALTMRRVATELGVGAMTLYNYVPGKEELLDLMLDAAYMAMDRADTATSSWRQRLTAVAEENRALFVAHPWAATVATGRPPLGPGQMHKYEHELRAFDDLGLSDVDRDAALAHLLSFVAGHAREQTATAHAHATDSGDQQWWDVAGPLLARVLDPALFPTAARVGGTVGATYGSAADPDRAWEYGLDLLLTGLSARHGLP